MRLQLPGRKSATIPRMHGNFWSCLSGVAVAAAIALFPSPVFASEGQDTCLMCHKYPGLGRYEVDANKRVVKRVFYVNEDLHKASYHGKLNCSDCHEGVDKIPHTDAKKVDCGKSCHVIEPSTGKVFSHKAIVEDLKKSTHGVEGSRAKNKDDLPACRDCHANKPYQLGFQGQTKSMAFLQVCHQCHEEQAWAERFFRHVNYRASIRRPSAEVVKLCSKCHANPGVMARHKLDVIAGFQDTYHAKAIQYGDVEVANCLNCHAPYALGFSPHRITSKRNKNSPTNADNKRATCSQSGCHIEATKAFATGSKVHISPVKAASLMEEAEESADVARNREVFQARILHWIKLFYQILIAAVIGGLGGHRLLDLYATHRDSKKGGH